MSKPIKQKKPTVTKKIVKQQPVVEVPPSLPVEEEKNLNS